MRRLPHPLPRRMPPASPLAEWVQAFADVLADARAELDRREYATWLDIVASRIAKEIAARLDLEERPS